ncbi:MAG: PqqD family protein [Sphingomonas bacterium]
MPATDIDDTMMVSRHQTMIAADVGDEAVILDVQSGYFFQLNRTAARVWALLEAQISVAELCAKMAESHSVDPALCRSDVIEFIADMRDRGLIAIG